MGRFLRTGLLFLAVVLGVYLAAMLVLCRVEWGRFPMVFRTGDHYHLKGGLAYTKFREWDPAAHYDVLVVGSSHAYRGYDPRLFAAEGLSMFNLGSSAQTPLNTRAVLRQYARPGQVGLVLFDVFEGAVSNDGLESTSELVMNIGSEAAAMEMALVQRDLRGLNQLVVRWMLADRAPDVVDSTYVSGGFSERTDSLDHAVEYRPFNRSLVRGDQLAYMADCLALCRQRGIPVVVVTHPQPHQADSLGHLAFRTIIDSLCVPQGVPYIDMALGHALSDTAHFYDHNHLNLAGVRRFNADLIERLRATGLIRPAVRP